MSGWFPCAKFPINLDLTLVDQILTQRDITHRFTEEQGHQILWLLESKNQSEVLSVIEQWRQNGLSSHNADFLDKPTGFSINKIWFVASATPATCVVILLGIVGALISYYAQAGHIHLLSLLNFYPFEQSRIGTSFYDGVGSILNGQVWRLVTPTFVHFGLIHITFNALGIWIFGMRIEKTLGTSAFILIFLFSAVLSNLVQAFVYGPNIFGGLSGVVYGLLGFIWIWQWRLPDSILQIPNGVIVLMLASLLFGLIGGFKFLGGVNIAHGAHFGGLVSGIAAGFYSSQKVLNNVNK